MTGDDQTSTVPRSTSKPVCSICEKIVDDDCDGTDEKKDDEGLGVAADVGRCDIQQHIMKQSAKLLDINDTSVSGDHDVAEGNSGEDKELHIAPMLDYSKREFRKLFSILSTRLVVWTDMVVDETIAHSDRLDDIIEPDRDLVNRQVCQIGGNCPTLCGNATQVVEVIYGYDEVNLNIDCPSDRVSGEREFGASLMKKVEIAYAVLESMQNNVTSGTKKTPVSIKCRIGVDDWDNFDFISSFIERLMPVCTRFYLHARKCVLNGLYSARQNRSVPPINYPRVYALCRKFPDVDIWINGGIRSK
jgi:tRNA-dihydrouridine synthase A